MNSTKSDIIDQRSLNVKTTQTREVEIEFVEWLDPHIGVIPINPKTPLILKAVIREEV